MTTEQDVIAHLDQMNTVVGEYLKGNDPTKISKELDIPYPGMHNCANPNTILKSSSGFIWSYKELENAITNKTKWLMLNSPSNPTGGVYSKEELLSLIEVLIERYLEHLLSWITSSSTFQFHLHSYCDLNPYQSKKFCHIVLDCPSKN